MMSHCGFDSYNQQDKLITNVGEDAEKKEPSHTAGGTANWYSHYEKQYGGSSKKLRIDLPYDPAIPLLGSYPQNFKTHIRKDI